MAWHQTWNDDPEEGQQGVYRLGGGVPGLMQLPGVLWILILNIVVFLLQQTGFGPAIDHFGALSVRSLLNHLQLWQIVTYQFLHADFSHIFWNMFGLWMFGRVVEFQFGTRRFLWLYLLSGVAGGLTECAFNVVMQSAGVQGPDWLDVSVIGASAGVMGVIVAYAVRNPNSLIYILFLIPVKAKWMALGWAVFTTYYAMEPLVNHSAVEMTQTAHAAHLGGTAFAFLWALIIGWRERRGGIPLFSPARGWTVHPAAGPPRAATDHPIVGGPNSPQDDNADERRLDDLLRKIGAHGLDSLTDEERRFLRRMSQRKRDGL
jgi:membrane associated rhomboid family serine protease